MVIGAAVSGLLGTWAPTAVSYYQSRSQFKKGMLLSLGEVERENVRDDLTEDIQLAQGLTMKSTLLLAIAVSFIVEPDPTVEAHSAVGIEAFLTLSFWSICFLFTSMCLGLVYLNGIIKVKLERIELVKERVQVQYKAKVHHIAEQENSPEEPEAPSSPEHEAAKPSAGFRRMWTGTGRPVRGHSQRAHQARRRHMEPGPQESPQPENPNPNITEQAPEEDPETARALLKRQLLELEGRIKQNEEKEHKWAIYKCLAIQTLTVGSVLWLIEIIVVVCTRLKIFDSWENLGSLRFVCRSWPLVPPLIMGALATVLLMRPELADRLQIATLTKTFWVYILLSVLLSVAFVAISALIQSYTSGPAAEVVSAGPVVPDGLTEWQLLGLPPFFAPTGVAAAGSGALVLSSDFQVARLSLTPGDSGSPSAAVVGTRAFPGMSLGDIAFAPQASQAAIVLGGRGHLWQFVADDPAASPSAWQGTTSNVSLAQVDDHVDMSSFTVTGLAPWLSRGLLLVAAPRLGIVGIRWEVNSSAGMGAAELRIPVPWPQSNSGTNSSGGAGGSEAWPCQDGDGAVAGLHVDEQEEVLYVLAARRAELVVLDLKPGSEGQLLRRLALPASAKGFGPAVWGGLAVVEDQDIFIVGERPPRLLSFPKPPGLRGGEGDQVASGRPRALRQSLRQSHRQEPHA